MVPSALNTAAGQTPEATEGEQNPVLGKVGIKLFLLGFVILGTWILFDLIANLWRR